ncbi:MAG: pirin family protein [Actinobacteria bacterium]|uniref:Unannotated protein n=1 Tax=freshwater metagenome TaxID=449393 RepID=A0A6J7TXI2_9ZZZZ|nr:pirin family protein [Actinomycetota bacterium]MTB13360.1 pirin family protein [Actinomycetota bacterium]
MAAITVPNTLVLPRVLAVDPTVSRERPATAIAAGRLGVEGAGFPVYRGFAGLSFEDIDPFLMLDQLGPVLNGPYETKGAPWHPHRGFETVTYVLDGEIAHHDSHGGGGVIGDGDTQWMTAGSGILHDEVPTDVVYSQGGWQHGIQLWVNLPSAMKFTPPRYQAITSSKLSLATSGDGGALIRVIAGEMGGIAGPGSTHTPVTIAHITLEPGSRLVLPWNPSYNAMMYQLLGESLITTQRHRLPAHHVGLFGPGDYLEVFGADVQPDGPAATGKSEFLLLGGLPIRETVVQHGPFVMNTKQEIVQAFEDYEKGRFGTIPALS